MPSAMMATSEQFNVRNSCTRLLLVTSKPRHLGESVFGFAFCFLFKGRTLAPLINAYYTKFVSKITCNLDINLLHFFSGDGPCI